MYSKTKARPNFVIFLLLLIFISPGILALWFFYHPLKINSAINHGHLLNPPIEMPGLKSGKWQWVVACAPKNSTNCQTALDKLNRIRLALGRHWYNTEIKLHNVKINDSQIWLMDKTGFVILTYALSAPENDLYADIKTLLARE